MLLGPTAHSLGKPNQEWCQYQCGPANMAQFSSLGTIPKTAPISKNKTAPFSQNEIAPFSKLPVISKIT